MSLGLAAGSLPEPALPDTQASLGVLPRKRGTLTHPTPQGCCVAESPATKPILYELVSPSPSILTGLMDAGVVAELQHVEVSALDAAADAVDAGDVGALALDVEQGLHHLLVAMVEKAEGGRHLQQEQGSQEGPQPPSHPSAPPGARTGSQPPAPSLPGA